MKRPSVGSNPSSGNHNHNNNIPPVTGTVLFNSYQKGSTSHNNHNPSGGGGGGYQPPTHNMLYNNNNSNNNNIQNNNDPTSILEETTRTYYDTENTANHVLSTLVQQRQQIQNTDTTIQNMYHTTQKVSTEITLLKQKYLLKKRQLYIYIILLSIIDILLFLRMIQCHGNFYCW